MLSMPAPMPTSIISDRICDATDAMLWSEEAHARLTVYSAVVEWKPTWFMAMRAALEPPSSDSTTPTATSLMAAGSRVGLASSVARSTTDRSSSGYASLSWPRYDRQMGVRRDESTTTSVGALLRTALMPFGRAAMTGTR